VDDSLDRLRERVRAWYLQEAGRIAVEAEDTPDLDRLDFGELNRRAQVLFACEMAALARVEDEDEQPRVAPGSPEYVQLQRVAAAMQAQGKEVPESIRQALQGGRPTPAAQRAPRRRGGDGAKTKRSSRKG
jgi:hypothetical protein